MGRGAGSEVLVKKIWSLIFVLSFITTGFVMINEAAAGLTSGDYEYQLINGDTEVEITRYVGPGGDVTIPNVIEGKPVTSIGDYAFQYGNPPTSVIIPDSVEILKEGAFYHCTSMSTVIIGNGITSIGTSAFLECTSLTNVTIPDNVLSLGQRAFESCTSLTHISIGNGIEFINNWAIAWCTSLTSIIIPENVTVIGNNAFYGSSLNTISIGPNVYYIGGSAFSNCPYLTSIDVDPANSNFDSIDGVLYNEMRTVLIQFPCGRIGNFTTPISVVAIADNSFAFCSQLTSIELEYGLISIGNWAFYHCYSLTNISMPNSLSSIGYGSFDTCSALATIKLPSSLTAIDTYAFLNCISLTSIDIPNNVTSLGKWAFANCQNLTSVIISNKITTIQEGLFSYCTSLTNFTIGDNITSIQSSAFYSCHSLSSVTIGKDVVEIQSNAFANCISLIRFTIDENNPVFVTMDGIIYSRSLSTLVIFPSGRSGEFFVPNGVVTIGDYAFSESNNLVSVIFPSGLAKVGVGAFRSCASLTNVTLSNSLSTIGDYAFENCDSLVSISLSGVSNVLSIGNASFIDCSNLTRVIFQNGVQSIGDYAFISCVSLRTIYFFGDAPNCGVDWLPHPDLTIYYWSGAIGYTTPEWQGVPTYPMSVPSEPINLFGFIGDRYVRLTWDPPLIDGGWEIDYYSIFQNDEMIMEGVTGLGINITQLTNGRSYNYTVIAHNYLGFSNRSESITVTPGSVPDAPSELLAIAGHESITLSWTQPWDDGGYDIDYYIIYKDNIDIKHTTSNYTTISNLVNGQTYAFTVAAHNYFGVGNKSLPIQTVPNSLPESPENLRYSSNLTSITLTWDSIDGASGYNLYRGESRDSLIKIARVNGTSYVDCILPQGTDYYYQICAVNNIGEGPGSYILHATTLTIIKGVIVYENGDPIIGAIVSLENGTSVSTTMLGAFEVMVTPGDHTLTISAENIESQDVQVIVNGEGTDLGIIFTSYIDYSKLNNSMIITAISITVIVTALLGGVWYLRKKK